MNLFFLVMNFDRTLSTSFVESREDVLVYSITNRILDDCYLKKKFATQKVVHDV